MTVQLAVVMMLVMPTSALAEIPTYDVDQYCKKIAGFGGNYSETMYDGCFQMEQSAYDNLKPRWENLGAEMRAYCDQIATFGGTGSYTMLEGCIKMEEQAASTNKKFKY